MSLTDVLPELFPKPGSDQSHTLQTQDLSRNLSTHFLLVITYSYWCIEMRRQLKLPKILAVLKI